MNARLRRPAALMLMMVGLAAFAFGAPLLVETISATWFYRHSPEAERAARPAVLLDVREPGASSAASPTVDSSAESRMPPRVAPLSEGTSVTAAAATPDEVPRYAGADELELKVAELRFDDPPEAGARARIVLEVHNGSESASPPLVVAIGTDWFEGYRLLGASPELIDDQISPESTRLLTLPNLAPGTSATYELHLTALNDDVTPPELRLLLADGAEVAGPQLQVIGPRPRPGLARALNIPRLNIQASVVQTVWEPPRFVVGQIQGSALLGEGNSVLVGHLTGPAGDVFARLDQLQTGDEVTAVSRGLEYKFVVSERILRPNDDSSPMDPTPTPRLTLMTCAGTWNPLTRDYSHRIWIVAEPPELAEATIAAQAESAASLPRAEVQSAPVETPDTAGESIPPAPAETPDAARESIPPALDLASPTVEPALTPSQSAAQIASAAVELPAKRRLVGPLLERWRPLAVRRTAARSAGRPAPAGLTIDSPLSQARVPANLTVDGARKGSREQSVRAWLVVRALQPGARWYLYPRELVIGSDGKWQAELTLGGPPGLPHELRVGVVDSATQAALTRQAKTHPNEPLDALPPGFWPEAVRIVLRR
jgi:LPXTG-site transpeptidase (sortase) family protein